VEFVLLAHDPALLMDLIVGVKCTGEFPKVLTGVKKVHNRNGAGEILIGEVPDPFGPVADYDLLFGAAPTAFPGFQVNSFSKLLGSFDSAGVGGGIGIADGITFFVPFGLSERTSQLDLPGVSWFSGCLSLPAQGLLLHH